MKTTASWILNPKPCREDELLEVEAYLVGDDYPLSIEDHPIVEWLIWQIRDLRPFRLEVEEWRDRLSCETPREAASTFEDLSAQLDSAEALLDNAHSEIQSLKNELSELEEGIAEGAYERSKERT